VLQGKCLRGQRLQQMIPENRRIKQKDTVLKLEISKQRAGHIINLPGFQKFVPGGVSGQLLGHFKEEGEGLLWQIVTGDKTWVLYYDPENSLWNTTIKDHKTQKKLRTKASAGKVMLTVFWNSEGVVCGFLEKSVPVTQNVTLKP